MYLFKSFLGCNNNTDFFCLITDDLKIILQFNFIKADTF